MKKNLRIFGLVLGAGLWTSGLSFAQGESQGNPAALRPTPDVSAVERSDTTVPTSEVDLPALKSQLQAFQQVLNQSIRQTFEQPFSLLQDAKGIYLPRFGVAFHLEVNLHPIRLISPFDMRPYSAEELQKARDTKLQRIRQLKDRLSELLLEHGGALQAVPAEQNVVVVVHLFNLPSEQSNALPTQLVIGTSRRALLDYQDRRLTVEEFRKREFFLEF